MSKPREQSAYIKAVGEAEMVSDFCALCGHRQGYHDSGPCEDEGCDCTSWHNALLKGDDDGN